MLHFFFISNFVCDCMPHTPSQFSLVVSPPFLIWSNLWVAIASFISFFWFSLGIPFFWPSESVHTEKSWKIKYFFICSFSDRPYFIRYVLFLLLILFFWLSPGIPCTASSCGITSASALPNGPTCRFDMSRLVFDFTLFFWSRSQAGWSSLFVWHFHCRSYFWYWFF